MTVVAIVPPWSLILLLPRVFYGHAERGSLGSLPPVRADSAGESEPVHAGASDVVKRQETLLSFGGDTPAGMRAYREFVELGLMRDIENPAEVVAARAVIGSEGFLDRVRRAYLLRLRRHGDRREEPELVRLQAGLTPTEVLDAVGAVLGVPRQELLQRKSRQRKARRRAMYCVCRLCRQRVCLTELARLFGVSVAGLTRSRDRVAAGTDARELERFVGSVQRQLSIA